MVDLKSLALGFHIASILVDSSGSLRPTTLWYHCFHNLICKCNTRMRKQMTHPGPQRRFTCICLPFPLCFLLHSCYLFISSDAQRGNGYLEMDDWVRPDALNRCQNSEHLCCCIDLPWHIIAPKLKILRFWDFEDLKTLVLHCDHFLINGPIEMSGYFSFLFF